MTKNKVGLVKCCSILNTAEFFNSLSQERKCSEISNPEADLQLIAPPANRELFKFRFAKARKMNVQLNVSVHARGLPAPAAASTRYAGHLKGKPGRRPCGVRRSLMITSNSST